MEWQRWEACRITTAVTGEERVGSTRGVGVCGSGRLGRAGFGPSGVVGLDRWVQVMNSGIIYIYYML
jgi:hypothetical protein